MNINRIFDDDPLNLSVEKHGVVLRRRGDVVETNIPHLVVYHSPTGYEWGYAGSGPADLALNIVELALRALGHKGTKHKSHTGDPLFDWGYGLHQEFKREFIATMPDAGGVIPWGVVLAWVEERLPTPEAEGSEDNQLSLVDQLIWSKVKKARDE